MTLRPALALIVLGSPVLACESANAPRLAATPASSASATTPPLAQAAHVDAGPSFPFLPAAALSEARPGGGPAPDAGMAPPTGTPFVRATKWVCDRQECEGRPALAYDYLPAVSDAGDLVAFVEERDGWGHTARVGIHLVSGSGEVAFLPTLTGNATWSYAEYAKDATAHRAVIDAANTELSQRSMRPLFPPAESWTEVFVGGKWVKEGPEPAKRRITYAQGGVRVTVTDPRDYAPGPSRFESLLVTQNGKEVVRKTGADLPDQRGCSSRAVKLEGIRGDVRTVAITYTNGMTSHACDGKAEPQVHHIIHW